MACLSALSLGKKGTNIAQCVVCTCQCTLQCHTETWSFGGSNDVLPCVSAAVLTAI